MQEKLSITAFFSSFHRRPAPPVTLHFRTSSNPFLFHPTLATTVFCGALIGHFATPSASATDRYWDINGNTAGFGSITGAWNGTNAFWNTSGVGGPGGALVASPSSADDLFVSAGTTGTITVSGAQSASSITLSAPVTKTISGTTASITIGGNGANSGLFSTAAASTISTPVILNSASTAITYRGTATGVTFTIGKTTGSATSGTQTISVEANGGTVALNGGIEDGTAGGKVAVTYSGTTNATVTGIYTYTGGTVINSTGAGILALASNSALGTAPTTINSGNIRGSTNGTTLSNAITLGGNFTAVTLGGENTLTLSGPVTLTGDRTITCNLGTTVSGKELVLSGAIGDGGSAFGITQNGTGRIKLSGTNTYSGSTVVSSGTLVLGNATDTILNTAPVIVSGGILDVANPDTVGAITLSSGTISGIGTLTGSSYDLRGGTVTAPLGGGTVVGKSTAGVVNLGGTQVYTDATNVTDGTLNITGTLGNTLVTVSNGAKLGGEGSSAGNVVLAAGSGFIFDANTTDANQYFRTAGNIDTTAGGGTKINIDLTAPATNTGVVVFEAASITSNGLSDFKLNARGNLTLTATQLLFDFAAGSVVWKGSNSTNPTFWDVGVTAQNWALGGVDDFFLSGDNVLFNDSASNFNPTVQSVLVAGTITFDNVLLNPYSLSGANLTATSLTKNGLGKATISNAITLSGGTTISAGTLQLGDGTNATGSVTGAISNDSALITHFGANNVTIANAISGTGSLTQSGAGIVTLTAANSYGATAIDPGATLQIGTGVNGDAVGTIGSGTITNNGILVFNRGNGSAITVANTINGSGSITKQGSGAVTLSSANGYTGATIVTHTTASGALVVTTNGALGTHAAGTSVAAGTTLGFSGGIDYATTELVSGSGIGSAAITGAIAAGSRGFIQSISGNNTFSGNIQLSADGISRIGTQSGASLTLTGAITQAPGITAATVLFRAGNTDGDFITLTNASHSFGTDPTVYSIVTSEGFAGLRLGVTNALPTNLSVAGLFSSPENTGSLDLNGFDQTLNGLIGSGSGSLRIVNLKTVTSSTLTLIPTADKASPTLIRGGAGLGVINLVKDGGFIQTLSGANTYTGTTTVTAGTLALGASNTLPDTTPVSLGSGTLNAATFSDTVGTLDVTGSAAINLGLGAKLAFADSSAIDWTGGALAITGTLVLGGPNGSLRFGTSSGGLTDAQLALITKSGSGPFDLDTDGFLIQAGYSAWQTANGTTQTIDLDHDNDGVPNGVEYFLGGNTNTTGFTPLPGVINTAGVLRITWTKHATYSGTYGTDFLIQTSATLNRDWATEASPGTVTINANEVTFTFPTGTKNFARLKVTGP